MRGDTAVTFRLLLRRQGLAGLAAIVGCATVLGALTLPWHEVLATVEMLGTAASRREATTRAWPGSVLGWLAGLGALSAMWLGIGIAIDRPVRWARAGLAAAAGLVAVCAVAAITFPPTVTEVAGAPGALPDWSLPEGVEMERTVRATAGTWITLGSSGLIALGAVGARDG